MWQYSSAVCGCCSTYSSVHLLYICRSILEYCTNILTVHVTGLLVSLFEQDQDAAPHPHVDAPQLPKQSSGDISQYCGQVIAVTIHTGGQQQAGAQVCTRAPSQQTGPVSLSLSLLVQLTNRNIILVNILDMMLNVVYESRGWPFHLRWFGSGFCPTSAVFETELCWVPDSSWAYSVGLILWTMYQNYRSYKLPSWASLEEQGNGGVKNPQYPGRQKTVDLVFKNRKTCCFLCSGSYYLS